MCARRIRTRELACLIVLLTFSSAQDVRAQVDEMPEPTSTSVVTEQLPETGIPGQAAGGGIGGPASVPAQLRGEQATGPSYRFPGFDRLLEPWFHIKDRLADEHRFIVGGDYNALYQGASETLTGNDDAASGVFRLYGDWTLFGEQDVSSGSLIFKGENRSRLGTDIPPSQLGFDAGYLGIPGVLFNDNGWFLSNLYWEQALFGKVGVVVGRLEPDSFIDVSGYANPWIGFQNLAINVNPTIPFPDVGFGMAAGYVIEDQWVVKGGFYDANGVPTRIGMFEEGGELFTHLEISWAPTRAERFLREIHVAGWHVDERENAGVPESWGIAVSGNWTFDNRWMPFFRVGWSEGGAPLMHRAATCGVLRYFACRGDLAGIGLSWEDPSDRSLPEQNSFEFFYRVQLAQNLAVTPSVQVLINPALNPNDDALTIFGLRGRLTF